jgi:hypothetical protein
MKIEKIGLINERENLHSVFDNQSMTAIEVAAAASAKVDECVDLVNGVEQSAIEATAVVDEMKTAQEQFITENADVRQQVITDNQALLDGLEASNTTFQNTVNASKTAFETDMTAALNTFKADTTTDKTNYENGLNASKTAFETDMTTALNTFKTDTQATVDGLENEIKTVTIPASVDAKLTEMVNDGSLVDVVDDQLVGSVRARIKDINFNVINYGAKLDGVTDDSAALVAALTAAADVFGTVFVPPSANGCKIASKNIVIPRGVTLCGITPRFKGYWGIRERGSTFLITASAGVDTVADGHNGAVFLLQDGSTIRDLSFYYPNQILANPPIAFPFLIRCEGYDDMTLCNLFAINVYQFIDASGSHVRLKMDNLYFDSYKTGIVIDEGLDVDKITNIHAWTFSTEIYGVTPEQKTAIITYKYNNHTAISIGKSDSIQLANIFVWGAKYGLLLGDNNKSPYGQAVNLSFDGVAIAIYTKMIGGQGFMVSNLMYGNGPSAKTAYSFPKLVTLLLGHKLGTLDIVNVSSWGGADNFIEVTADYGSTEYLGTKAHTQITNAQVYDNGNPEFVLNNGVGGDITIRNMRVIDNTKLLASTAVAGTTVTFENNTGAGSTFSGVPQTIKEYATTKSVVNVNSAYGMDIGGAFVAK